MCVYIYIYKMHLHIVDIDTDIVSVGRDLRYSLPCEA